LIMAKYGVEYVLRWLPIGTHDWHKFLKPSEIEVFARKYDLQLQEIQGFNYNIFKDQWNLGADLSINYMMVFTKKNS
ncbi:MAG: bifunctional 3-demethylubiquinol 3-O-methyltransferase/2-polyprenyl-6-hydroxyphenol methylase, partial [Alphaproteobacteria bacterium]